MQLTFDLKDVVYLAVYFITFVGMFASFRSRLIRLEDKYATIKSVMFQDKGGLNIIDKETCKGNMNTVHEKIRQESRITRKAFENIDCLNQNIIKIMMHMKLKPITVETKGQGCGED